MDYPVIEASDNGLHTFIVLATRTGRACVVTGGADAREARLIGELYFDEELVMAMGFVGAMQCTPGGRFRTVAEWWRART